MPVESPDKMKNVGSVLMGLKQSMEMQVTQGFAEVDARLSALEMNASEIQSVRDLCETRYAQLAAEVSNRLATIEAAIMENSRRKVLNIERDSAGLMNRVVEE